MPKSLGFLIATVVALVGCGSSGPDVPLMDWTVQVSGLARGAVAEFEVTGPEGETRSLALEVGPEFKLRDIRAGTYDIALQDVQLGDKTWTPTEALLQLELQLDGTAVNRATGAVVSTALYEIRLAYAAVLLGAAIADPVYPVFGRDHSPYVCDAATAGSCVELATGCGVREYTFPVSANDRAYFGTSSQGSGAADYQLFSCDLNNPGSCSYLDDAGGALINALIYANNSLYAGLSNGIIWKCDPNVPDSCADFNNAGVAILSLAYGNGRLYAGLDTGILWTCDPNIANGCGTLDHAAGPVQVLAYGNNRVYAGIEDNNGTLWSCDPAVPNSCLDLDRAGSSITWNSMIYANNRVYAGFLDKQGTNASTLWSCDPAGNCDTIFVEKASDNEHGIFGLQYTGNQLFFSHIYKDTHTDFWKCDLGSCPASGSFTLEQSFPNYGTCCCTSPGAGGGPAE